MCCVWFYELFIVIALGLISHVVSFVFGVWSGIGDISGLTQYEKYE
jgi:hypothetical protein